MAISWRQLFAAARIEFRERGANTSRGHVNICCPFCGDDSGFHLSISESKAAYYCRRNPDHAGRNPLFLLLQCGIIKRDALRLLAQHTDGRDDIAASSPPLPAANPRDWDRFKRAHHCPPIIAYLEKRGFNDPHALIETHDLRFAQYGTWAQRLLLPLTDGKRTLSWTGRSIRDSLEPKYLVHECEEIPTLFAGTLAGDRVIICEGPLDALKLNAALSRLTSRMSALALSGKALTAGKLLRLATAKLADVWLCLDNDCPLSLKMKMLDALKANCRCPVYRLDVPPQFKDPGEMRENVAREWLARTPRIL